MLTSAKRQAGRLWSAESGFSLLEISVVLVIVAIIVAIATPGYRQWQARSELKAAATEISSTMALSRMAAMNRNQRVTVTVNVVSGRVQLGTGGVIAPATMGQYVTAVNPDPSTVQFSSLGIRAGGPAGANQLVTLTNSQGLTYSVAVTPQGKVNWCPAASCS
jgi:prepilin-type N-terminal cleavage/methylation domain-containing protein